MQMASRYSGVVATGGVAHRRVVLTPSFPQVVPHPEFEWALYDIGGVLGFAAYMSIAWHMMHVLKWHVARREARAIRGKYRRKRRPRASTSSSNGSGGRGSTGSGRPSGPASSASYGSLSTNAELVKMAPIMRGQLCKCNTVVFTSGTAVTASAALFVVSYLAMYAVVFLSYRHHTEDAIHLLHKRCIPIFFLSGASLVIFTLAVACVAFWYAMLLAAAWVWAFVMSVAWRSPQPVCVARTAGGSTTTACRTRCTGVCANSACAGARCLSWHRALAWRRCWPRWSSWCSA